MRGVGPPECRIPPNTHWTLLFALPLLLDLCLLGSAGTSIRAVQRSGRDQKTLRPEEKRRHTEIQVRDMQGTKIFAGGNCKEPEHLVVWKRYRCLRVWGSYRGSRCPEEMYSKRYR